MPNGVRQTGGVLLSRPGRLVRSGRKSAAALMLRAAGVAGAAHGAASWASRRQPINR